MMKPLSNNLGDLIFEGVQLTPHKIVLIGEDESITYEQLDRRMNQAGHLFRSLGVEKGDRVALLFENDTRFIEICFGLMRIGAVPVCLNAKLGVEALTYIVQDSEANVLVFSHSLEEKASGLHSSLKIAHLLSVGAAPAATDRFQQYEAKRDEMPTFLESVHVTDDDLCMLLYTSGSTGKPKGCMLTHGGQWWNADTMKKILLLDCDDRSLISVPLYHKNAMINAVKPCLMAGGSMVVLPGFDPERVVKAIDEYQCTYTTGVPAMYKKILSYYKDSRHYDISSLKFAICGSSVVSAELVKGMQSVLQVDVLEEYGLTEGGPQVLASPRWGIHRQGSAGLPIPGCEVKVVNVEDGQPLGEDEVGELWVRNPGIAKGYWHKPEITRERLTEDGWLKTGDLVRFDKDGYGYIMGRIDDLIITGGENVYPKEIEDLLLQHDDIEDVCVIAKPHDIKGKVPVAFVKKNPHSDLTEKEVKNFFLERGPAYAHPRNVFFIDEMPLSGTGKIDRKQLASRLERMT